MDELSFRRGYYVAVAELIRTHDQPTIACDLLRQFGAINFDGIDEYDRTALEAAIAGTHGRCEHGIEDGEYCKPCNLEYKRAAKEVESV